MTAFEKSLPSLTSSVLLATLEDIKVRIGDGVLHENPTYVADQKKKGIAVLNELQARSTTQTL